MLCFLPSNHDFFVSCVSDVPYISVYASLSHSFPFTSSTYVPISIHVGKGLSHKLVFFFFVRESERESKCEWQEEGERQRERENGSQEDSILSTKPNTGLDLITLRS